MKYKTNEFITAFRSFYLLPFCVVFIGIRNAISQSNPQTNKNISDNAYPILTP